MKIKLRHVNNDSFVSALRSLSGQRMDTKAAYKLGKIIQAVESAVKQNKNKYIKIAEKYAEKDGNGKFQMEDGHLIIKEDEKVSYNNEFEVFLDTEVEIPYKISVQDLKNTNLAPQEIMNLDPIITTLEIVTGETK